MRRASLGPIDRTVREIKSLKAQARRIERKKRITYADETALMDLAIRLALLVGKLARLGEQASRRIQ